MGLMKLRKADKLLRSEIEELKQQVANQEQTLAIQEARLHRCEQGLAACFDELEREANGRRAADGLLAWHITENSTKTEPSPWDRIKFQIQNWVATFGG